MALLLTVVVAAAVAGWVAFILGRSTADNGRVMNHHKMMMLLVDIRTKDDTVPFLSQQSRLRLDRLLSDYERLDLNDDRGSTTIATIAGVAVVVVAALIAIVALSAMINPGPSLEEGRVVAKEYDDADRWYQPGQTIDGGQTCTGGYNGQTRTCTDNPDTHIPGVWHHDPERFLLKLEGPHPEEEGKTLKDTISVPESFYDRVRVGQWVDVDSMEIVPR